MKGLGVRKGHQHQQQQQQHSSWHHQDSIGFSSRIFREVVFPGGGRCLNVVVDLSESLTKPLPLRLFLGYTDRSQASFGECQQFYQM